MNPAKKDDIVRINSNPIGIRLDSTNETKGCLGIVTSESETGMAVGVQIWEGRKINGWFFSRDQLDIIYSPNSLRVFK